MVAQNLEKTRIQARLNSLISTLFGLGIFFSTNELIALFGAASQKLRAATLTKTNTIKIETIIHISFLLILIL